MQCKILNVLMKKSNYILILFFLVSCSSDQKLIDDQVIISEKMGTGTYQYLHQNQIRDYYYYSPQNLDANAPLLFVLHGYGSNKEQLLRYLDFRDLAQKNSFALVYPQGLQDGRGNNHWNSNLQISQFDDVGFLSELANHLTENNNLNKANVFICGFSNGGFMAYELAIKAPEVFNSFSSITGTMSLGSWQDRTKAVPVSFLQISGALDLIVPVTGMDEPGGWGGAPPMDEIISFWANQIKYTDLEVEDNDIVSIDAYSNTDDQTYLSYYLFKNMGHEIPNKEQEGIDAVDLVWGFFKQNLK